MSQLTPAEFGVSQCFSYLLIATWPSPRTPGFALLASSARSRAGRSCLTFLEAQFSIDAVQCRFFGKPQFLARWCLPQSLLQEMPVAIVRRIWQFGQLLPFFLQRSCRVLRISVQWTTFLSRYFLSRIFWMAINYGRNREKCANLRKMSRTGAG